MTNGSESLPEYPGRPSGPGTGFTVGNRFVDEAYPGQVFVIGRTTTALGNVDVYDTEGRYHLITRCTIVGGPEDKPERTAATDLDGATERGPENAYPAAPGAFAARWNEWTEEQRGKWLERAVRASQESMTCFQMLHEGRLEQAGREVSALRGQLAAAEALIREMGDATDIRHGGKLDRLDRIAMLAADAPSTVLGDVIWEAKAEALEQEAREMRERYPEDIFKPVTPEEHRQVNFMLVEHTTVIRDNISADIFRRAAAQMDARAAGYRSEGGDRG